jgi:hypothetical protein
MDTEAGLMNPLSKKMKKRVQTNDSKTVPLPLKTLPVERVVDIVCFI